MRTNNQRMSDAHEEWLADTFGGRQTKGSGNQWRDQMDVRSHRMDEAVAFAWDGKATLARSITVKRDELNKAAEQCAGERPAMAYRFYDDLRLRTFEDWVLVRADDMLELIERSRRLSEIEATDG